MGPQFFETRMGQTFYDGTMPRLVDELKALNANLGKLAATRAEAPSDTTVMRAAALERVAAELDAQVWTTDTLDRIADIVRDAGLRVRDPLDADVDPHARQDWQYEVANGDTVLGFADWVAHRKESRDDEK